MGEFAVIARRNRMDWHLGAMTDGTARSLKVLLDFLPAGRYTAEIWHDDAAVTLQLDPAGGAYVKLTSLED